MSTSGSTRVEIYGQSYQLQGGNDSGQAARAAALVDQKMNLIATQVTTSDRFRIAVLAALHLADECLSAQQDLGEIEAQLAAKLERIEALLDQVEAEDAAEGSAYREAS